MADERRTFAGDLMSGAIDKSITVRVPARGDIAAFDFSGVLRRIEHNRSVLTGRLFTFVELADVEGTPPEAVAQMSIEPRFGVVLEENWVVTVR